MDAEIFTFFLGNQYVAAERATKLDGMLINVIRVEEFFTDLHMNDPFGTVVFLKVIVRGTTVWTGQRFWNVSFRTAFRHNPGNHSGDLYKLCKADNQKLLEFMP